ncbi:Complete genome; segment 11/17 [Xenorhabdus bovienii str. kraussei Quebec]|uniref:Complete genome segment 11/17 n=2 Tax=Xenorhabdus bovienii TaxID=40576 RepID=A0A077PLI6_XENBV|nr:RHS repeat-associated core domain-containing protein [Xenorhabdus bovienii]CDH21472.1 Complete genome; segment 11/17 [Xenorhabdus bovienii str. kraussei Quebec]
MAEKSSTLVVTPTVYAGKEFCEEFNIRTQAEAETALGKVDTLYPQSSKYYGAYGDDPELDEYYNDEDAKFEEQYFKKTAQDAVDKFKSGEFPLKEWEEKEKTKGPEYPQPNSPLPAKARDDSPTGTGNTPGIITAQAGPAQVPATEANPLPQAETPAEKSWRAKAWAAMVEAKDSVVDWAHEKAINHVEGIKHPLERAKGQLKGAYNTVVGTAESYIQGAYFESAKDSEDTARWLEIYGETEKAKTVREVAGIQKKQSGEFNLNDWKATPSNQAQEAGIFDVKVIEAIGLPSGKTDVIKKGATELASAANKVSTAATKAERKVLTEEAKAVEGAKIEGQSPKTATSSHDKPQNAKEDHVDNKSTDKDGSCNGTCKTEGEPVDMATGDFLQVWPVIAIPGLLPITLTRTYRSTANLSGLFGPKWADDWSRQLKRVNGKVNFTDADGVIYDFSTPKNQVLARNQHILHYVLTGELNGELQLTDRQSQLTYHFNHAVGSIRKLSAITDRRQNAIRFIYDKQSQLIEVTRTDGFRLILGYQNQYLQTVDYLDQQKQQRLVTCHYDPQGYLHECDAFQHNHLWHEYDAQGWMIRWHDTDQTDLSLTYDEQGRVLSTTSPRGYWCDHFHYDDQARITTYRNGEGGETQYHYDHNGLVVREVDPLGRIIRRQWRHSQIVWEADRAGGITTFDYNPDGALTEVKLPTGETFAYGYDEHGQLIESVRPTGERWPFHYDEQGNLTALTHPLGHKEEYQYGTHGELRQRLLPDGRQWHYAYDEQQRLAAVVTPDGQTTNLQLDELGHLRQLTDALKQQTHYRYSDAHASLNGSLTEVELPDGTTQQLAYDSERRVVAVTDGEGRTTRYTYGAFDLLNQVTRPDGTILRFGYDRLTRLKSVTASTGETYRYERDVAGQIIRETDFTGRTIDYQYDKLGRRIQAQYPDGQQLRWHYSAAGSLIKQESWQPEENQRVLKDTTTYEYNQRYQLVKATHADATVEYEYDKTTGLPTCERINGREITRKWDNLTGRPVSESVDGNTLHFGYNLSGSLNHFQLNQHVPLTFQHDALGQETVRESANGFILASRYTATGLLTHQSAGQTTPLFRETLAQNDPHFPPQATAVNRSWQYDRAHNVRVIDDSRWGQTRYRYNTNDQILHTLFEGARPHEEQFSYDTNGNLSQHLPTDARGAVEQITQRQKAGRVVQQGDIRYRYDDNGCLVEKTEQRDGFRPQIWRYRWDTQNQLTHCETPDGSRWHYRYDAFGRRIRKLKVHDGKLTAANLQRWLNGKPDLTPRADAIMGQDYLWSGDQLIEETPIYADGTPVEDQRIRWLYEPGSLTPSARVEKGKLHYIVSDHQGTPREMLSEEGVLVWAQRLTTWGKAEKSQVIASNNPDYHVSCNLRFMGQYEDEESGLYYNRFRYYSPETAQYISPDPIGLMGGVNPYSYVHNPVNFIDPLGLAGDDCGKQLKLSSKNPVPKSVSNEYENIITGKGTPRVHKDTGIQKTLEDRKGKTNKFWIGAKEWQVVHSGKGIDPHHRIVEQTLPNGQKIYGYALNHDYEKVYKFPSPWYPDGGKYPGHKPVK